MNRRLNHPNAFRIVTRMKKTAYLLAFSLLAAVPAFAQTSEFGILLGGSRRLASEQDTNNGISVKNNWQFGNSVKEVYYAVELEPGTEFKLKAGQLVGAGAFRVNATNGVNPQETQIRADLDDVKTDHVDAIINYKFSEPFGSTGLFAGVGLYRAQGSFGAGPLSENGPTVVQADRDATETNYGFSAGVNGDFPINKRYGVIVEGTYHWINYHYRPRYLTLAAGLRISF